MSLEELLGGQSLFTTGGFIAEPLPAQPGLEQPRSRLRAGNPQQAQKSLRRVSPLKAKPAEGSYSMAFPKSQPQGYPR